MENLTGDLVWKVLSEDPRTEKIAGLPILEPYVKALPEILKSVLEEKVTMATYMKARILYYRYLSTEGVATKQIALIPKQLLQGKDRNQIAAEAEKAMIKAIAAMEAIIPHVPQILIAKRITENEYFTTAKGINLKSLAAAKYNNGTLTIGDLLMIDPYVLVGN